LRNRQHEFKSASARGRGKKGAVNAENDQGIGISRGGRNTKIHALVDALGNPVKLLFTAGNINDNIVAVDILYSVDISGSIVMGDKAYGAKKIRDYITENGSSYAIPPKANAKEPWECDWWQYKERHLVECFFNKIKNFRRVATRYEKLFDHFKSFVFLASIMVLLK
jgi:transposase